MNVYQYNPAAPSDDAFEPGRLEHLVVGNVCRLLDPRRTPFTVIAIQPETGSFIARIDDFEDKGATWETPFEDVGHYQFAKGSPRASAKLVAAYETAKRKFDQPLQVACDDAARRDTETLIEAAFVDASDWLKAHSLFLAGGAALPDPATRRGSDALCNDLLLFMAEHDLKEMERVFAEQFVRNPYSGEIIKGHRIVLAEMGLVPFEGKAVRDPNTFTGKWSRDRRRLHIVHRLAFVRAFLAAMGKTQVTLYRGLNTTRAVEPPRNMTFISATFDRAVAESHYNVGEDSATRALLRQSAPSERVFMTYLETGAMNERYLEAEAALLWQAGNNIF